MAVLLAAALVSMPPLTACVSVPPHSDRQYWVRATEIVVQPWRGEHHVYGVFTIPVRYRDQRRYTAELKIYGLSEGSPDISSGPSTVYDEQANREHYLKRVYFPTRMAFWFLLTGRFGDLTSSCHWWLAIVDR